MGRGKKKRNNTKSAGNTPVATPPHQNLESTAPASTYTKAVPKIHAANPNIKAFTTEEVLKNTVPCNVVIKTKGQEFSAHKTILAAKSEYFQENFQKKPQEKLFYIPDISDHNMKWILNFLYTEYLAINERNAYGMLEAALILKVRRAADHCFRYLTCHNVMNSCVPTYIIARKYNERGWPAVCQKYIIENFEIACNEKKLYELPFEQYAAILQSKNLVVSTETIVYLSAIKWINHKPKERQKYCDKILRLIRFPQMKLEFLKYRVMKEQIIHEAENGKALMSEAFAAISSNQTSIQNL